MTSRRQFMAMAGATAAAPLITPWSSTALAQSGEPFKVGFIYLGPAKDGGWTEGHDRARQKMEANFGGKVKTTFVENVPESADAERVVERLVREGNKLIFSTSFGYMDPIIKVARNYPDTVFMNCASYKTAPNVGTYNMRLYDGAYLLGVVAGLMSKTGTIGFLASFPLPAVFLTVNGYTLGARSVNPKIKTKVVWVSSWYDPAKERQAAETLISQGADCLAQITDSPAALIAAQEKGVYAFGWDTDMQRHGPKAHLTAATTDWSIVYTDTAKQVMAGSWKTVQILGGAKDGWLQMSPLNPAIPAAAAKVYEEKKAALSSGKLLPFAGPVNDNTGAVKFAAGTTPADKELYSTNWFVEGIEGTPPK